jgi:hypothetical protein
MENQYHSGSIHGRIDRLVCSKPKATGIAAHIVQTFNRAFSVQTFIAVLTHRKGYPKILAAPTG